MSFEDENITNIEKKILEGKIKEYGSYIKAKNEQDSRLFEQFKRSDSTDGSKLLQLQDDRQSVSSDSNKKTKNNEGVFGIGRTTIDNRVRKDKKYKLDSQGNELTEEQQ